MKKRRKLQPIAYAHLVFKSSYSLEKSNVAK
jgi:hypothetical protein